MNRNKPTILMILDGYGIRKESHGNAIAAARKPNLDMIFSNYPFITLEASGKFVGLPDGQIGNSEVGHTNIGAGNVVLQDLPRINRSIETGEFYNNKELLTAMENARSGHTLHIMGLCSDGGVHSKLEHLYATLELAKKCNVNDVVVHCYLDGRDVPPKSALKYLAELEEKMNDLGIGRIGVISGRFYAMDRDKRWERLEPAYNALTLGEGIHAASSKEAIKSSYEKGEYDEFLKPAIIDSTTIKDGDSVIFINFRPDRAREITRALVDKNFDGFKRKIIISNLVYVCMTEYDSTMPNVSIAFPPAIVEPTLGSIVSAAGLKQLRIAETEKYAHVTFFFNGGTEAAVPGEDRILIPSPKVATYDLQPEMSAPILTEKVIDAVKSDKYDLIILNFANPDMVGHTGVFDAAVKAIETLDTLVKQIIDAILAQDGQILLTADHGNADYMLDDNDNIVTKHSLSPVPLCHIANTPISFKADHGKLADITPTLLTLMGLEVPKEMHGNVLV